MTPLEQRLIAARERLVDAHRQFITEVLVVARDATIEALERAFAEALAARPRLAGAPHDDTSATADAAPASAPTEIALSTTDADRVLARIREVPGSHVSQLSQSLAMPAATVRRHVKQLAAKDAIRIEGVLGPWYGQRRQTFFPREPDSVGGEAPATVAEASA